MSTTTMPAEAPRRRVIGRRSTAVAAVLLIALAACGSDDDPDVSAGKAEQSETTQAADTTSAVTDATTESTEPADSTDATDSTDTPATDVSTTESESTDPPATTEATTTEAPTTAPSTTEPTSTAGTTPATTVPAFEPGWRSEPDGFGDRVYGPLDQSNWTGVPSPPLPPAGEPLTDGIYQADTVAWDAANPTSLGLEVERLDPCTALPEDACNNYGDPYLPTDLGVNESATTSMTVLLDGSIEVVLVGYECESVAKSGNGSDLAALFSVFDTAYNATIVPRLTAGFDSTAIIEELSATPTAGFSGVAATCPEIGGFGLVFHSGEAPPILLQAVTSFFDTDSGYETPPLTPITATDLHSVQVIDGKMTLYFYAGFYS